jgi:hypothetical protein
MFYIGHFSFDEIDAEGNQRHGYFSAIVECRTPDDAVAQFESHIKQVRERVPEMANVVNIYIEDILKFTQLPKTPVITRLQSSAGEFPASISHSLPGVMGRDVDAFGFAPDVEKHEIPNDGSFIEAEPFISFNR